MADKKAETVPQVSVKNVPLLTMDKMQTIAGIERVSANDLYIIAFNKFVDFYEAKNGKVKVKPRGKGLQDL